MGIILHTISIVMFLQLLSLRNRSCAFQVPTISKRSLTTTSYSARLRLSYPGLAENAVPTHVNGRYSSNGLSLDTVLIAEHPEIVLSHLKARKANLNIIDSIKIITELRLKRNEVIKDGDAAKNLRKSLSQQIGMLMKENKLIEVEELKKKVESANEISAKSDGNLAQIETQINDLFSMLPNLIDDRFDILKNLLVTLFIVFHM